MCNKNAKRNKSAKPPMHVIGIGIIRVIYTASAINADSTSITLKGFIIGPFIFGLRI